MERLKARREAAREGGFTLIELLVVIAILGILAGVVVFSVAGIDDKGEDAACEIDARTLATAEEANFASKGAYTDEAGLETNGFISDDSSYYDIASFSATGYDIDPQPGAKVACADPDE